MSAAAREQLLLRRQPLADDARGQLYLDALGEMGGPASLAGLSDAEAVLSEPEERAIAKDLARVGWSSMSPGGGGYPQALARVLRVVLRGASILYNQSLSFIAAHALVLFRGHEGNAASLVGGILKQLHLGPIFSAKNCSLQRYVDRFDFIFSRFLPSLFERFRAAQFNSLFFAVDWFTTLFVNSLSKDSCCVMWDFILLCDFDDSLFIAALAILWSLVPRLQSMDEAELMLLFKSTVRSLRPDDIIEALRVTSVALENSYLIPNGSCTLRAMETSDPSNKLVNEYYDATFFMRAVQLNDAVRVQTEADKYKFPRALLNYSLFRACLLGHAAAVHQVLEAGADANVLAGTMRPLHAAALLGHADVVRSLLFHGANSNLQWAECTPRQVIDTCCKVMSKHVPKKAWLFQSDYFTWYHTVLVFDGLVCVTCGGEAFRNHQCLISHTASVLKVIPIGACRNCGVKPWTGSVECSGCRGIYCSECAGTFQMVIGAGCMRMCNTCLHFAGACACSEDVTCDHASRSASGELCECKECITRLVRARGPKAMVDWMVGECVVALRALERSTRVLLNG